MQDKAPRIGLWWEAIEIMFVVPFDLLVCTIKLGRLTITSDFEVGLCGMAVLCTCGGVNLHQRDVQFDLWKSQIPVTFDLLRLLPRPCRKPTKTK